MAMLNNQMVDLLEGAIENWPWKPIKTPDGSMETDQISSNPGENSVIIRLSTQQN